MFSEAAPYSNVSVFDSLSHLFPPSPLDINRLSEDLVLGLQQLFVASSDIGYDLDTRLGHFNLEVSLIS